DVVDRFEDQTQRLLDDLVTRGRDAERPPLAVGLRDVGPPGRLELEALVAQARDQVGDGLVREPVERRPVTALGSCCRAWTGSSRKPPRTARADRGGGRGRSSPNLDPRCVGVVLPAEREPACPCGCLCFVGSLGTCPAWPCPGCYSGRWAT